MRDFFIQICVIAFLLGISSGLVYASPEDAVKLLDPAD